MKKTCPSPGTPVTSLPDNLEPQRAFIERGLLARDAAKADGVYISAEAMLARLDDILLRIRRETVRLSTKRQGNP